MASVEAELLVNVIRPPRQVPNSPKYREALVRLCDEVMTAEMWKGLSDQTTTWYNYAIECLLSHKPVPEFTFNPTPVAQKRLVDREKLKRPIIHRTSRTI